MKSRERMPELGPRLLEARKRRGYTQAYLAEEIDAFATQVCMWEKGKWEPSLRHLARIARILGCSTDWLLGVPHGK